MAGSLERLGKLHELVTDSFIARIEEDMADNLPTDAATLAAAAKFLKDNEVSVDPAETDKLDELREAMINRSKANKANQAQNVVELAMRLKNGTE